MAEVVPPEVGDLDRGAGPLEGHIKRSIAHGITPRPGEDGVAVALELGEGGARRGVERHVFLRVVLRLPDRRKAQAGVQILPAEP